MKKTHISAKQKRSLWRLVVDFVKLNLAGNVLFWGTMGGYFVFHELLDWPHLLALAVASIIAHILFFILDKEWVFAEKGTSQRKTRQEISRFIIFMTFNYFLNLAIVTALTDLTPLNAYLAQIVSSLFFGVWNFIGLKWWVFKATKKPAPRRAKRRTRQAAAKA